MTKNNILHILRSILYGGLFLFLVVNILFSQQFSPLYSSLMKQEQTSFITFFKQSKDMQDFDMLYPEVKAIYEENKNEIFADEIQRKALIQKLEVLLQQNPNSRDVLYSLYLLHEKNGDTQIANQYLQQAQRIDPGIQ